MSATEGPERDWVFARRFAIRDMIEHGDPAAADRLPDIPDTGAMQDEIEALRSLVANARVQELDDTEWFCPKANGWVSCPGTDDCEHDQSRTVIRRVLAWHTETRFQSEALLRARTSFGVNEVTSTPAGADDREDDDRG